MPVTETCFLMLGLMLYLTLIYLLKATPESSLIHLRKTVMYHIGFIYPRKTAIIFVLYH